MILMKKSDIFGTGFSTLKSLYHRELGEFTELMHIKSLAMEMNEQFLSYQVFLLKDLWIKDSAPCL